MSLFELKRIIYIGETVLGILLLVVAWRFNALVGLDDPTFVLTKFITLIVGIALLIFGGVSYLLRDDPEIWR